MKLASLTLLIVLTIPLLAPAQAPEPVQGEAKVVLTAPSTIRVGELARFDVSESVAAGIKWLLIPHSVDFEVYADGRRAVFSARVPGKYRFVIACAKGDSVDVITHVITVVGPPTTPLTDSFEEWIPFWNWTLELPKDDCKALAESFEEIASQVDDLDDAEEWIKATAKANRKVLGDRIDVWGPMLDKLGAKLLEKAENGALSTPKDHQKVWLEIAKGLRNCL